MSTDLGKVKRSTIPTIRNNMIEKGALLLSFTRPEGVSSSNKEDVIWFRKMEELGFLVTTSGCMFPYENYSSGSKGRPRGAKLSALFFKGNLPSFPDHQFGWPTEAHTSHLCHRKQCVNPNHIAYEPQWKNLKRNYCGESGKCDCGVKPKCLASYRSSDWQHDDELITYESKHLVKAHLSSLSYRIRPKDHFSSVDKRTEQRNERLKRKSSSTSSSKTSKRKKQ